MHTPIRCVPCQVIGIVIRGECKIAHRFRGILSGPCLYSRQAALADIVAGSPRDNARLYKLLQQLRLPVDQAIDEHGHQWLHVSYGPRNRRSYFSIDN